jgi:hypothetical protein
MYDSIIKSSKFDILYSSTDKVKVQRAASVIRNKMTGAWVCVLTSDGKNYHLELSSEWGSKITKEVKDKALKIISKIV